jgi:hypothetical protein
MLSNKYIKNKTIKIWGATHTWVEKFDQKACVPITKRHEFIGQALEDRQARVVRVGMMIHSATHG